MEITSQHQENEKCMVAYLFEVDKFNFFSYGEAVFEFMVKGKEIQSNRYKVVISCGDILQPEIFDDISPFVIKDNLCTVYKKANKERLYVFVIEDITVQNAKHIDIRLKKDCPPYIGMTSIDIKSHDTRKQFWKHLIRSYSIECNTITVFGCSEGDFGYDAVARQYGFQINYDGFYDGFSNHPDFELYSTRQSSFIQKASQLKIKCGTNDADRGIWEMNFALGREVRLAGVLIWKAIEDINRIVIYPEGDEAFTDIDYMFTSLYSAAQGTERLLKTIIELINYQDNSNVNERTNKLLYGHNHQAMYDFIMERRPIKLKPDSIRLLECLNNFYNKARYQRFHYSENDCYELELLRKFGNNLKPENFDDEIKRLYGRALGGISHTLYQEINVLSCELNIYLDELNGDSTSVLTFLSCSENLYKTLQEIEQSKRELFWYLMTQSDEFLIEKCKEISALSFDPADMPDYLSEIIRNVNSSTMLHEFVATAYDEMTREDRKRRIEFIKHIHQFPSF